MEERGEEVLALGVALLSFRKTFRQRYDDELIRGARRRRRETSSSLRGNSKTSAPSKSGSTLSCRDIRLSNVGLVSKEKKRDQIIYFRMYDVAAAEAALHFVSSYDGFREINRKVG